ncbi:MAG: RlmE family RNA methyltransferase, partial [Alkalispirochaeta sp.]
MAKKGRRRQDHLARRARHEGYRARSVYKLEEIDGKYDLLGRRGVRVLDLGAAPGSWSQYAVGRGALVVAVDLQEITVAGATCITGDFTEPGVIERIVERGPFDLVLSDAAPATTGNRVIDTGRSEALVESILAGLDRWLVPDGALVAKLFQGGAEQELRREVQERFRKGVLFRPDAVRRESFETYLVGIGFTG